MVDPGRSVIGQNYINSKLACCTDNHSSAHGYEPHGASLLARYVLFLDLIVSFHAHVRLCVQSFAGKTNVVLTLSTRLIQPEEEWKDKCVAFQELRQLISEFSMQQNMQMMNSDAKTDVVGLFTHENVQTLTQPFRVTVVDLRSTVVKEACITLSLLVTALGPMRSKFLVRDVFPTLLEARGGSNKVSKIEYRG